MVVDDDLLNLPVAQVRRFEHPGRGRERARPVPKGRQIDPVAQEEIARASAARNGIGNVAWREGSWFEPVRGERFDLIVLDIMMPNMDGSSFLSFLRKSEDLNKNTPIIMLTAFMPTISAEDEVNNKTFYLKKPIDFEKMLRFIKMAK